MQLDVGVLLSSQPHRLKVCESVRPVQESKTAEPGKEGSRVEKNTISPHPRKVRFESKESPFSVW